MVCKSKKVNKPHAKSTPSWLKCGPNFIPCTTNVPFPEGACQHLALQPQPLAVRSILTLEGSIGDVINFCRIFPPMSNTNMNLIRSTTFETLRTVAVALSNTDGCIFGLPSFCKDSRCCGSRPRFLLRHPRPSFPLPIPCRIATAWDGATQD